jgi:hypothetical protein
MLHAHKEERYLAYFSRIGAIALHGPHQVAKQSTMTLSFSITAFWNSSALGAGGNVG